jgi:uncharacterized protein (TIGR02145 family)
MKQKLKSLTPILLLIILTQCNPDALDDLVIMKFKEWTPYQFTIEDVSLTERQLFWVYDAGSIDGFKIDRKRGDEDWVIPYCTLLATDVSFLDTISFNSSIDYNYRIYSYNDEIESMKAYLSIPAAIPSPKLFAVKAILSTSASLQWDYSNSEHTGFKILRKIEDGDWELLATLEPETREYSDVNLDLNNKIYYYRIFAYFNELESLQILNSITKKCGYPFIDFRDNHQYETVEINDQCWMKENLAWLTTVTQSSERSSKYPCFYVYEYSGRDNRVAKSTYNYRTYGVLYNWPAALVACPDGWHLPSYYEYGALFDQYGGVEFAGASLKETGTEHWQAPNLANNESGFSALPGGNHLLDNYDFSYLKSKGAWWTSEKTGKTNAVSFEINHNSTRIERYHEDFVELGFSVRCIRDE